MRILFVAADPKERANARYRCGHLIEALHRQGVEADFAWAGQKQVRVAHDVVVLHRIGLDATGARFRDAARACGAVLVYSTDDLIFEPEFAYQAGISHPQDAVRYRAHQAVVHASAAMAHAADALIVSTEFLAGRARLLTGKPVHVVRNFVSDELLSISETAAQRRLTRRDRITLGYLSGSPTHDADLADIAGPLRRVLRRDEDVNLLVVGTVRLPPGFERFGGRVQRHPFVDWRELPALLAGIDINLAPLDPTRPFNHAKSEVKFLEAAAVRVPTVAAATAGFAEAVCHAEEGLLARERGDWDTLLTRLIAQPGERAAIAEKAHAALHERATVACHAAPIAALFNDLADLAGKTGAENRSAVTVKRSFAATTDAVIRATEQWVWRKATRVIRHTRLMAEEFR